MQWLATEADRGIYLLFDDSVIDNIIACLSSIRAVEPTIPICFIPFGGAHDSLAAVCRTFNASVWADGEVLHRCDEISLAFHGQVYGHYRKIATWFGGFRTFLYLDTDTVLLRPLEEQWALLAHHDVVVATSNKEGLYRFVWKREPIVSGSPIETAYSANTGFFLSRSGLFSPESLAESVEVALSVKEDMELSTIEQPLLNVLMTREGVRHTSLSELRRQDVKIPLQKWAGRWSGVLLDLEEVPLFIHWAGVWRQGQQQQSAVWRHFRQLREPLQ